MSILKLFQVPVHLCNFVYFAELKQWLCSLFFFCFYKYYYKTEQISNRWRFKIICLCYFKNNNDNNNLLMLSGRCPVVPFEVRSEHRYRSRAAFTFQLQVVTDSYKFSSVSPWKILY